MRRTCAFAALPFVALGVLLAPYVWPPDSAANALDVVGYHAPQVELLARGLRQEGGPPRWNPLDFAGIPHVADPQAGLYEPAHWLLALSPSLRSFGWLIVVVSALGALGFLRLARALGCGWPAAAVGATCFALGGSVLFRLVALGHLGMAPVALLPWALLGIERCAEQASIHRCVVLSGVVAWMAVSMHPQLLVYTALFLTAAGLAAAYRSRRPFRTVGVLGAVGIAAAALSAVHWLPAWALAGEFARAVPALADPTFLAPQVVPTPAVLLPGSAAPEARFHLGFVASALAIVAVVRARRGPQASQLRFHLCAALGILLAGAHLSAAAFGAWFRHPERVWIIGIVPVSMLVTLGVQALPGAERARTFAAALAGLALAVELGLGVRPHIRTAPEASIGLWPAGLTPTGVPTDARVAEPLREITMRGMPELGRYRHGIESLQGYNPIIPWRFWVYLYYASDLDPKCFGWATGVLVRRKRQGLLDRLAVTHYLYPPQTPLGPWRWERAVDPLPRAYLVPGYELAVQDEGDPVAASLAVLRRLEALDPRKTVVLHGDVREALASAGATGGAALEPFRKVAIRTRDPDRIVMELSTARPAILVLSEPWFPGWRARDGDVDVPVLRANELVRALALAPGSHEIELVFAPTSWRWGRAISLASLALLAGATLAPSLRRRRREDDDVGERQEQHRRK
jgi:hypothetical protein